MGVTCLGATADTNVSVVLRWAPLPSETVRIATNRHDSGGVAPEQQSRWMANAGDMLRHRPTWAIPLPLNYIGPRDLAVDKDQ